MKQCIKARVSPVQCHLVFDFLPHSSNCCPFAASHFHKLRILQVQRLLRILQTERLGMREQTLSGWKLFGGEEEVAINGDMGVEEFFANSLE